MSLKVKLSLDLMNKIRLMDVPEKGGNTSRNCEYGKAYDIDRQVRLAAKDVLRSKHIKLHIRCNQIT